MTAYVALLRAVNLGGSTLAMADLKRLCEEAGYRRGPNLHRQRQCRVRKRSARRPRSRPTVEERLKSHAGKRIDVMVRTADEMRELAEAFPFKAVAKQPRRRDLPRRHAAADALQAITGQADDEKVALGKREIYVAYGKTGIGRSKLKIPAANAGTARNINTVQKLAEMAEALRAS